MNNMCPVYTDPSEKKQSCKEELELTTEDEKNGVKVGCFSWFDKQEVKGRVFYSNKRTQCLKYECGIYKKKQGNKDNFFSIFFW